MQGHWSDSVTERYLAWFVIVCVCDLNYEEMSIWVRGNCRFYGEGKKKKQKVAAVITPWEMAAIMLSWRVCNQVRCSIYLPLSIQRGFKCSLIHPAFRWKTDRLPWKELFEVIIREGF